MPTFIFQLQALLDQRSHAERQKQLAVATIERQRLDLESRVTDRQTEIRSHKNDLRDLLTTPAAQGVDFRTVRLQANASLHAQLSTQRLALQLAGLYHRLDAARKELREAATRRRAVELLKQKRFDAWKREQHRLETNELDEIATLRHSIKDIYHRDTETQKTRIELNAD
jgi:flagellar FliJ protein